MSDLLTDKIWALRGGVSELRLLPLCQEAEQLQHKCEALEKELAKPKMPDELTAENGAKGLLIGDFKQRVAVCCPECGGDGENPDEEGDCEFCDGDGSCWQDVVIDWTTIKDIYKKAAKYFLNKG